jgi:DNA polymerase-3 subunit delta'
MTGGAKGGAGSRPATDHGASPPRANPWLAGHDEAEAMLRDLALTNRLPHAWLFCGPAGIGKATLAFRFARFLLAGADGRPLAGLALDPSHPTFRRVASGGHADLLTIERMFDEKRNRRRSEIVVDDVRRVSHFLHATPAEGGWRLVIVDGADEMNRNAANALLKILEEPPQRSLLLLIADQPGRLVGTVRSRCRCLSLRPLSDGVVGALLARYRPDASEEERRAVTDLAQGSIGRALTLLDGGGSRVNAAMAAVFRSLPALDLREVSQLCQLLTGSDREEAFPIAVELLQSRLQQLVRPRDGPPALDQAMLSAEERQHLARLAAAAPLDRWLEVWDKASALLLRVVPSYLDQRQVLTTVFLMIEAAANASAGTGESRAR